MRTAVIKFRDAEHEVEYKDYGYEYDTGAHVIDWNFVDKSMNDIELTDDEDQNIYDQLLQGSPGREY